MDRLYLSYLNQWINSKSRKPLVLRGARQVGKSFLVRDFAAKQNKKLFEINLERHKHLEVIFETLNLTQILDALASIFKGSFADGILFLDEIQATPSALAALRYFYEDRPDLVVIAAGSLLEFTLSEHKFSMPVGRIEYLHIGPFTFEEYLNGMNEKWLVEKFREFKIGDDFSTELHRQFLEHYRKFIFLGGMPAALSAYVEEGTLAAGQKILENIKNTYEDDFAKYALKADLARLQKVYLTIPSQLAQKIKYTKVLAEEKSNIVRRNIDYLIKARISLPCYHSSCSGIPLVSQKNDDIYKLYWLDVGLANRMLDVDWHAFAKIDFGLLTEGVLAEQFVAQHLANRSSGEKPPALYYWLREGKANNAEVDFVIQIGSQIVPIEVKAGAEGKLKSLLQFVAEKDTKIAVRFWAGPPQLENVEHSIVTAKGSTLVKLQLLSLPVYFVGKIEDLLMPLIY